MCPLFGVQFIPPSVYKEIKKRGLYEVNLPPEARLVRKWIYEKIDAWKAALDSTEIEIELGGSLVSGLFVLEGAKNYDVDVKFIVKDPTDPDLLKKIETATGLTYRKTLNIKELPEGKNTAVLLEKVLKIPGITLPIDVEGLVRQGPYFNSHKFYTKLFTPEELEAVRRKKQELRNDKTAYKKYKYEVRDELVKRAKAAGLI